MFGLIMIGAVFLASGGLIAGLGNAVKYPHTPKRAVVKAKKLDTNNNGLISFEELTSLQNRLF